MSAINSTKKKKPVEKVETDTGIELPTLEDLGFSILDQNDKYLFFVEKPSTKSFFYNADLYQVITPWTIYVVAPYIGSSNSYSANHCYCFNSFNQALKKEAVHYCGDPDNNPDNYGCNLLAKECTCNIYSKWEPTLISMMWAYEEPTPSSLVCQPALSNFYFPDYEPDPFKVACLGGTCFQTAGHAVWYENGTVPFINTVLTNFWSGVFNVDGVNTARASLFPHALGFKFDPTDLYSHAVYGHFLEKWSTLTEDEVLEHLATSMNKANSGELPDDHPGSPANTAGHKRWMARQRQVVTWEVCSKKLVEYISSL